MARDQDVAGLAAQAIANPFGRVVRLQISGRAEIRQGVAGPPERLCRLTSAEFAAMPDNRRAGPQTRGGCRQPSHVLLADRRQRTTRIDLGTDRVAVVDQYNFQLSTLKSQLSGLTLDCDRQLPNFN